MTSESWVICQNVKKLREKIGKFSGLGHFGSSMTPKNWPVWPWMGITQRRRIKYAQILAYLEKRFLNFTPELINPYAPFSRQKYNIRVNRKKWPRWVFYQMFQKCSNFLETKLPILLFLPRHHFKQYRTLVGSKDFEKFWKKEKIGEGLLEEFFVLL